MDPDEDQHSVGPDMGPNRLQRLSADNNFKIAPNKKRVRIKSEDKKYVKLCQNTCQQPNQAKNTINAEKCQVYLQAFS